MKLQVFALFDSKLGEYAQPFCAQSIGVAVRSFQTEVNRDAPDNSLNQYPDDFHLSHLGEFDTQSGAFESVGIQVVAWAADLKRLF